MTSNTVLLALKLPVSDVTVQSPGSLLKAELDCSDTIRLYLIKIAPVSQVSPDYFLVSGSLAQFLSSGCMSQFAILCLLFSNVLLFFSLVNFICGYMLGIFWFAIL